MSNTRHQPDPDQQPTFTIRAAEVHPGMVIVYECPVTDGSCLLAPGAVHDLSPRPAVHHLRVLDVTGVQDGCAATIVQAEDGHVSGLPTLSASEPVRVLLSSVARDGHGDPIIRDRRDLLLSLIGRLAMTMPIEHRIDPVREWPADELDLILNATDDTLPAVTRRLDALRRERLATSVLAFLAGEGLVTRDVAQLIGFRYATAVSEGINVR